MPVTWSSGAGGLASDSTDAARKYSSCQTEDPDESAFDQEDALRGSTIAMKIGRIALVAVLSFAGGAVAEPSENSDYAALTREQWRARIDAAKARIQEMRREGRSFTAPPVEDSLRRILEDETLVSGDIVVTKSGTFQFIGGTVTPHNIEDFRQVVPDRAFPHR